MRRSRKGVPALIVLGLVVTSGVWLAACREKGEEGPPSSSTGVPEGSPSAPFAAAPPATTAAFDKQQALVEKLVQVDPTKVPRNVDPAIWKASIPPGNEPNEARVALGKKLYFDTRLSPDRTIACASCHDVTRGFTDMRPVSQGIRGQLGRRNAPTTMNAALFQTMFLDGRSPSLEEQAKLPIVNPIEMGEPDGNAAVKAIADDTEYQNLFQQAYGRSPNFDDLSRALASFERTLMFLDAPFDRFVGGETNAVSEDARAGWVLFNGKGRCNACHQISPSRQIFSDDRFHNIGVAARHQDFVSLAQKALALTAEDKSAKKLDELALQTDLSELGRFMVTRNLSDIGAFKTSQLRNIGVTAPYMHDGSLQTLWDVIDHYNKGGEANPYLDGGMIPLALTETEIDQLVAFLFTLTSDRLSDLNQSEMARQRAVANKQRPFRDNEIALRRKIIFDEASGINKPGTP